MINDQQAKAISRCAFLEQQAQAYREKAKHTGNMTRMMRVANLESAAHNKMLALGAVTGFRSCE